MGPPPDPAGTRRSRLWPAPRVELARVHGRSMEPTLREGDLLLVRYAARPRPGGLVLARLPCSAEGPRPLSVKRVLGPDPEDATRWWLERDNPAYGVDSWLVGGIPGEDVVAVVLLRLPRWLGGRLPGTGRGALPG